MAAYDMLIDLVQEYFIDLGYNNIYVKNYFSNKTFKELISIRLANANVMIKNKTDSSSHQTHIAITGEAIEFFFDVEEFKTMDNKTVLKRSVSISKQNLEALYNQETSIKDTSDIELISGYVTLGKRTQKQVQLSKRNTENSECFNSLRLGLYENDLLIILKFRDNNDMLAIGIPQTYYLDYIPNYANKYETNTYLRLPKRF
jgi:hypothetical protein